MYWIILRGTGLFDFREFRHQVDFSLEVRSVVDVWYEALLRSVGMSGVFLYGTDVLVDV